MKRHISLLVLCLFSIFVRGDNDYQQRLNTLHYQIPLPYNDYSKNYIEYYLNSPQQTEQILSLWLTFGPRIEKQIKLSKLPEEIKYLPIALSNLNHKSTNQSGGSGPWLLMFNDGKMQKLKQTSLIDERRDWEKSTTAACNYFLELLDIYKNDWLLALAAYTCTPAVVNKAILTSGTSMNYWSIYQLLPEESRDIVPKYVAAVYICNFYKHHDLKPPGIEFPTEFDTIKVDRKLTFEQISTVIGVPVPTLELMNPIYKKNEIPFSESRYLLILPKGKGKLFEEKKYDIYSYIPVKPIDEKPIKKESIKEDTTVKKETKPSIVKVSYMVKKGDDLVSICDYFDCTLYLARYWNRLRSNYIVPGRVLYFYVNEEKKAYYEGINKLTLTQKKKLKAKD